MCRLSQQEEHKTGIGGKTCTYDEAMELTGHGRYNYLLLAACSVISNAVALDMFGLSIILAAARCDLQLGLSETGILASAPFAGVVVTWYPWGYFADTRGRRRALLLSTTVGFIFAAGSSLAPSWQLMMLCKLLACSFSSASYALTMTMLGECTGASHRSNYLFIMNSINLVAECFSFGLAYFLLPMQFSVPIPLLGINFRPWRLLTVALALPLGAGGLMMAYLHESPKFLASRGDNKKALEVLNSIHEWNGGKKGEYQVEHLTTEGMASEQLSFWQSLVQQTVPIFKPPLLWRTLQICYLLGICIATNNAFVMWYPTIVNMFFNSLSDGWDSERTFCTRLFGDNTTTVMTHGQPEDTSYVCDDSISSGAIVSGILYGLFFCITTLLVSKVASRRRLVLVSWLLISAVSGTLVELYHPAASLAFFILFQTSIIGVPSLAAYCVDLYPTAYRGMVTSLGMMVARLSSLAAVNLVAAAVAAHCALTFYLWALLVFSGVAVSLFLPSDKKMNSKQ